MAFVFAKAPWVLGSVAAVTSFDADSVAKQLNDKFFENPAGGQGLLTRLLSPLPSVCDDHQCEPWKLDYSNSFSLISSYSWSKNESRYVVFRGDEDQRYYGWPGFIATPEALESMVECSWPRDGWTFDRNHEANGSTPAWCGCHKDTKDECSQPDGADWCTVEPHTWLCTYKADELVLMMETFNASGGGDTNRPQPENFYGYNEVLVDRQKWANAVPDIIWAFVIPLDCPQDSECYRSFAFWYEDWKVHFGEKPIVQFDAKNKNAPYSVLPQPHVV